MVKHRKVSKYYETDCRIKRFRGYKNFERKAFNNKLQVSLKNVDVNNSGFIELKTIFMELLDKVASVKSI